MFCPDSFPRYDCSKSAIVRQKIKPPPSHLSCMNHHRDFALEVHLMRRVYEYSYDNSMIHVNDGYRSDAQYIARKGSTTRTLAASNRF